MTDAYHLLPARVPQAQPGKPLDSWITPEGQVIAQFFRVASGIMLRFPEQVDFTITADGMNVCACPAPGSDPETIETLFHNAIIPVIGNHSGKLHLHGSAVALGTGAIAFLAPSRRGKTTLAGAFSRAGHPFMAEDLVALTREADASYILDPQRPFIRLFADSAAHLLGDPGRKTGTDGKQRIDAGDTLPYCDGPARLDALFLLGPGSADKVEITAANPAEAFRAVMQQAFILDVEDKQRLKEHFGRVSRLAQEVPCYHLDYTRNYGTLPEVIEAIVAMVERIRTHVEA